MLQLKPFQNIRCGAAKTSSSVQKKCCNGAYPPAPVHHTPQPPSSTRGQTAPRFIAALTNLPTAFTGFMWIPLSTKVNQMSAHVADRQLPDKGMQGVAEVSRGKRGEHSRNNIDNAYK